MPIAASDELLPQNLVRLNASPAGKEAAIQEVTQLLVASGCVDPAYGESMLRREAVANTYLGHGVVIPHGRVEDRNMVRRDALAVLQVPQGLDWNPGQTAHLIVGIAARSDSHIDILRRLTRLLQDEAKLQTLFTTADAAEIVAALSTDSAPAAAAVAADLAERLEWVMDYPTGLHARPASIWVEAAKSLPVPVQVRHGAEAADARNAIGLLQLGIKAGDTLVFSATGQGAAAALERFKAAVAGLSAQEKADAARAAAKVPAPTRGWNPPGQARQVLGVGASPGLVIGPVHILAAAALTVPDVPMLLGQGASLLTEALERTRQQLRALVDDTTRRLGPSEAGIFKAQAALLDDTDLITLTCQLMVAGHGPAFAWNEAVERMASRLRASATPLLAARAADLHDVGRRVLLQIDPSLSAPSMQDLPDTPSILIAPDLSPSDTAGLDMARVIGLATASGGPTSHTAILARTLGLPAMVAGGNELMDVPAGTPAILDGDAGRLYLDPGEAAIASARAYSEDLSRKRMAEEAQRSLPARTRDGREISIGANVNRPDQVPMAIAQGGEGVGLMRTEFLFLESGETPGEDAQYETYRAMIEALGGRQLIVRALDIGGDKQVAHLNLPHEDNPFLGVRGARLLLRRPDLLDPQLRALYRAARDGGDVWIMFPMIMNVTEVKALRAHCERIRADVGAPAVPVGIMIEVPAAAIQADILAAHVDFFSIGTNDLTQYALAVDRQNPDLAAEADSLSPAVLRLIQMTVAGARRHDRWVGVCGGLAGDPFGACLLAGLGVAELSMTPRDIPAVKARLRDSRMPDLTALAEQALRLGTAAAVRALEGAGA
jgi:phosphocarrier protein FPr